MLRLCGALLCGIALSLLSVGSGAHSYAAPAGQQLLSQQIRYHLPEAGAVVLVWGLDGWATVPEELRPAGTYLDQEVMHTPLTRDGATFVVTLRTPRETTIDYGFRITAKRDGTQIEPIWDGSENYHAASADEGVISINSAIDLAAARPLPSAITLGMYIVLATILLAGCVAVLWKAPPLRYQGPRIQPGDSVRDTVFLGLVVLLSLGLYVGRLGFYSDDWAFLAAFALTDNQSLGGLFWANYSPHTHMRPVQILYFATLYWLFGVQPLGYHLVNAGVFVLSVVLFYLALRELRQSRLFTLTVPVVYALLPHYSADRFWVAAFQANLSMGLYFLSLYADLRTLRATATGRWGWKLLGLSCLILSGLAYEVALPLFLFNTALVWHLAQASAQATGRPNRLGSRLTLAASSLLALAAVLTFKIGTTTRLASGVGFVDRTIAMVGHAFGLNPDNYDQGLNVRQALETNYGEQIFALPATVWQIMRGGPEMLALLVGAALGLLIFGYLLSIGEANRLALPATQKELLRPVAWGLILFGLGYAIFFTTTQVQFSATGIGNRTAIAAAVGIAVSVFGGLGAASGLLMHGVWRVRLYCLLVSLFCTGGFFVINNLATYWADAYERQQAVLAAIDRRFPALPDNSTLLLDGVCPYAGPAIVFESNWDLTGLLQIHYQNPSLRGEIVTPNLHIDDAAITTSIYDITTQYPYKRLFVYRFGQDAIYPLSSAEAAHRYFQAFNPTYRNDCPIGRPGFGVPVF